jgi:AraC-like DNA-binding protein
MSKLDHFYEPHLEIREISLPPGKEWRPRLFGWSLILIGSGSGYWLENQSRTELETGTVLLMAGDTQGHFLASQLNVMPLFHFSVIPDRLSGLITLEEQKIFSQAVSRKELAFRVLPPSNPVALKMNELCANRSREGLSFRLAMLQLLVEIFDKELNRTSTNPESTDATQRLRLFLKENPPDALLEISFNELAQITNCTARHLSRIFQDVAGMSFSNKRAEIRLVRARELLATSESKVVEVAMESGYKTLSLFNVMFTRRFGTSPGRWRKKWGGGRKSKSSNRQNALIRDRQDTTDDNAKKTRLRVLQNCPPVS